MTLPRRKFLHLAAGAAVLSAVSPTARAQTYPTRPDEIRQDVLPPWEWQSWLWPTPLKSRS
jgi:hypothetical protein